MSFNALHTILHDVDEHLLEKHGVEAHRDSLVCEPEVDADLCRNAEALEEGAAGLHFLTEVAELQGGFWNLNDIGEAGDEVGHGQETVLQGMENSIFH